MFPTVSHKDKQKRKDGTFPTGVQKDDKVDCDSGLQKPVINTVFIHIIA